MADPISEKIGQRLLATLQTVTTANGYENTLIVERKKADDYTPGNLKVVLYESNVEQVQGPDNYQEFFLSWNADLYLASSNDASSGLNRQTAHQVWADSQKAVDSNYQLAAIDSGGVVTPGDEVALDSEVQTIIPFTANEAGYSGWTISIQTHFRYLRNNPFST